VKILFEKALLGLGLINYFNVFDPTINKLKYNIECNKAEKSLWQNIEENDDNLYLLNDLFKDDLGSFSLFFGDDLIKFENIEEDKPQSDCFIDQQTKSVLLEDIVGNLDHWILEKHKKTRVKFAGRTDIELTKAILEKFDNQPEKFLEVLGLLKLTNCHKLIKKSGCLRLIHHSISQKDSTLARLDNENPVTTFSYLLGECNTYQEDIENENMGGLTITMKK